LTRHLRLGGETMRWRFCRRGLPLGRGYADINRGEIVDAVKMRW
jgi:hypothetical protein